MIKRIQKLSVNNSFFLFGARGVGKSTLINNLYNSENTLWIDLLLYEEEEKFSNNPDNLKDILTNKKYKKIVIDEVQKVPKILDVIQKIMGEQKSIQFILTGSSARKIKRGSGNLLAGRAFIYFLYPFSIFELEDNFSLSKILKFGTLPEVLEKKTLSDKEMFLKSYIQSYLKEEIVSEQIIRNLNPFRNFLNIVAQQNGEPINYHKIAQDVKVDDKTIQNYFSVLEDTQLGFFLESYHMSIRKRQRKAHKFYLFDTGVKRALDKTLTAPLDEGTFAFGKAFEHRVILECFFLNEYFQKNFKFFYLKTTEQSEIDLIIERPGKKDILVEIKSTKNVEERYIKSVVAFQKDWPRKCEVQVWSQEKYSKTLNGVSCVFWKTGLKKIFSIK